jgi:hypothetical protein
MAGGIALENSTSINWNCIVQAFSGNALAV